MKKKKSADTGEPRLYKKVIRLLLNWHLWLSVGVAWLITNGWCYIMLGIGTYHEIAWMVAVAGAYFAFLWLPFTPEKILTAIIAIFLHKVFFPRDEETLTILKEGYGKVKEKWQRRKEKKRKKREAREAEKTENR